MPFSPVFGGSTIYPSNATFLALALVADVTLQWPIEQASSDDVVADIIEVTPASPGLAVILPDARQAANGYTALFNNRGADSFTVESALGVNLVALTSGTVWQLYLADNSTEGGTWRVFQYGAGVSNANAAALAGAGLKAITTTLNQRMEINSRAVPYVILDADRAKAVVWTGAAGTFTLPTPASVGSDWFVALRNSGTGSVTTTPAAGTIDGSSNLVLAVGESAFVVSDGANYFTVGLGQDINSVFDFISLAVPGTGDRVLAGAELNRISYEFTGILTGNRNIIVPAQVQQYWVDNQTTGAFDLTVKTPAGAGVIVPQGQRRILYCDGVDVIAAETFIVSTPVAIVDGGTGATTAAGARTSLGVAASALVLTAGVGLTGGGDLTASRSFALDTANTRNVDHAGVTLSAGAGLTGGGDITTNRTFAVGAGTGITVNADDVALDIANTRNVDHAGVTVTGGTSLAGGGAITASQVLTLLNDSASPGNSMYYGTNSAGTKGFFTLAAAVVAAQTLATDGGINFAAGWQVRWGTSAGVGAGGSATVTFTTPFTNACFATPQITATNTGGTAQACDVADTVTAANFVIHNAGSVTRTFTYIAVGF